MDYIIHYNTGGFQKTQGNKLHTFKQLLKSSWNLANIKQAVIYFVMILCISYNIEKQKPKQKNIGKNHSLASK